MSAPAVSRRIAAFVVLMGSIACGSSSTPTEPAPVYDLKTETFSGTIAVAGKVPFSFTVVNPGDIHVAITQLMPVGTLSMGIALGFWEAASSTCVEQLSSTSVTLNVPLAATPSSAGDYCVAIFDTGNVQVPSDFTLSVTHY
jgi:hypothetical protein